MPPKVNVTLRSQKFFDVTPYGYAIRHMFWGTNPGHDRIGSAGPCFPSFSDAGRCQTKRIDCKTNAAISCEQKTIHTILLNNNLVPPFLIPSNHGFLAPQWGGFITAVVIGRYLNLLHNLHESI